MSDSVKRNILFYRHRKADPLSARHESLKNLTRILSHTDRFIRTQLAEEEGSSQVF